MRLEDKHDGDGAEDLKRSFEETIRRYDGVIRKVCYFYAADLADFDDLRQEALVNLWRGFPRFRGEASLSTWIYRVTLNSCVSFFRKHRKGGGSVPIDEHSYDEIASIMGRPRNTIASRLRRAKEKLNSLTPDL